MRKSSRKDTRDVVADASAERRGDPSLEPLSLPKDAAVVAFLDELRADFLAKGYRANGSLKPDAQRDERIDRFVKSYRVPLSLGNRTAEFSDALTLLLKKFERLCERTEKSPNNPSFTRTIYRYLADQLLANVEFFNFPKIEVLPTPTLMTSQPLISLVHTLEQRGLPTARRLLYRAFASHSQGVVEFFELGAKRLAEIDSVLAKQPGSTLAPALRVQLAFFRLSQDIEKLVANHRAMVDEILTTSPYKDWFRGQRSVVETVVCRFKPDQVREKLKELKTLTTDLLKDDDVKPFSRRRSAVLYAALSHFSFAKAKEQLLKAHKLEERLVSLHKSSDIPYNLKELRDSCLKNYDQAKRMAELLSLR